MPIRNRRQRTATIITDRRSGTTVCTGLTAKEYSAFAAIAKARNLSNSGLMRHMIQEYLVTTASRQSFTPISQDHREAKANNGSENGRTAQHPVVLE